MGGQIFEEEPPVESTTETRVLKLLAVIEIITLVLLIAFAVFIAVLVFQINSNTHELLHQTELDAQRAHVPWVPDYPVGP